LCTSCVLHSDDMGFGFTSMAAQHCYASLAACRQ
jgi:hypothetical protein